MDVDSDVPRLGQEGCSRMHPDPDQKRPICGRSLDRTCRLESVRRRLEHDEECIALRVDDNAAAGRTSFADDATVVGKQVGIRFRAEPVEQPRRAFGVRENERDRSRR